MTIDTSFTPTADLELQLLGLWNKFLNRSDLTIDDDFFESGGDSLLATELLFEVERLMQDAIPPSILFETGTVRDLARRLAGTRTPQLTVKVGGEKGRLFLFFHGDFNHGGLSVRNFSTMLGADRPVLAIAPHGMDGQPLPASIEQMAAERLPLILDAQPRGPYLLGGHCNGALVAFETARLLVRAGHTVDLLVMIDPVTLSYWRYIRPVLLAQRFARRTVGLNADRDENSLVVAWSKLRQFETDYRTGRLSVRWKKSLSKQWKAVRRRLRLKRPVRAAAPRPADLIISRRPKVNTEAKTKRDRAYAHVLSEYNPAPLDVPVLFVALGYDGRPWRRISQKVEIIDAPGHHKPGPAIIDRVRARLDALDACP